MFNASISNRQNELQDQDERDVGRRRESLGAVLFLIIGMMMGADLFGDSETGADWEHLLVEAMVMALAIVGVVGVVGVSVGNVTFPPPRLRAGVWLAINPKTGLTRLGRKSKARS